MADGEYGCQCGGEREAVKANLCKGTHLEREHESTRRKQMK
jgi:hypothetical protein